MVPWTIPNWRQRRCETLLLGLYAGLILKVCPDFLDHYPVTIQDSFQIR